MVFYLFITLKKNNKFFFLKFELDYYIFVQFLLLGI